MKIALGMRLQSGPWGGGNRFGAALDEHLRNAGWTVVSDLKDADIDLILLTDPRRIQSSAFQAGAILRYLLLRNRKAIVVHRVNECDERKGGVGQMNAILRDANPIADHTVFVSSWLKDLHTKSAAGWPCKSLSVILNGADPAIFRPGESAWDGTGPLKLVTHHWGGGYLKGFDIYRRIDEMLVRPEWRGRIEFSYIGNVPPGFKFHNARHVSPLNGAALADELRSHHVYVTGSQFEPGGNHQNEGAACGLPLLYRDSGSMREYCDGYGIVVSPETLERGLTQMMQEYPQYRARMPNYPNLSPAMVGHWQEQLMALLSRRDELIAARRWPAMRGWMLRKFFSR